MKDNKYDKFIEQKRFENDLKDIFENVSKNIKEEKLLTEATKKKAIKNVVVKKPVLKKEPKQYVPPKPQNNAMFIAAEKFIPNNFQKKDIGVDINALAATLKADPNFMARIQPRPSFGNMGSGLGHKEAQQLIDASIALIPSSSSVSAVNVPFDNTSTTLSGTDLQNTTEELDDKIVYLSANPSNTFDEIQLDINYTSAGNPAWQEGLVFYDVGNKCPAYYGDKSDVTTQIGQEGQVRVINKTGVAIPNGSPVEITSASDGLPMVENAVSKIGTTHIIGIATHDIADDDTGLATMFGTVSDVDLSSFTVEDSLYLSTSAGVYVNTPLASPYSTVEIGHVVDNSVSGKLLVSIQHKSLTVDNINQVYVSISGTDSVDVDGTEIKPYKSIKFALNQITDNDNTHRYIVLLSPGTYNEDNPIQLKSFVDIKAIGHKQVTTVVANNDDTLFLGAHKTNVESVGMKGYVDKFVVDMSVSGNMKIEGIGVQDSNGIYINDDNAIVKINNITFSTNTGTVDKGFDIHSGNIIIRQTDVFDESDVNTLFNINGINSIVTIKDVVSFSPNLHTGFDISTSARCVINDINIIAPTHGVVVNDGANIRLNSSSFFNCVDSGLINTSGAPVKVGLQGITFDDNTNYDVYSDVSGSLFFGNGFIELSKVYAGTGVKMYGMSIDLFAGDEGVNILGELHVGTPEGPAESVFGEGDSYTRGMLVYTYNAATSAYTDVSSEAGTSTGSTFAFPGNAVDNAIYIGSTLKNQGNYVPHYGYKNTIVSAHDGTGYIIAEIWDGSNWIEINNMTTEGNAPYYPESDKMLAHHGSHHVRYNAYITTATWIPNDDVGYGENIYWSRLRISSSTDIAPILEQIKIHSNRMEINADGWPEYFGKARPVGTLPWDSGLLEAAAASPGNQDIYLSDTLDIGRVENKFANGATDRMGFLSPLPLDCDTSTPIKISWSVRSDDNTGGNIDWVVRSGFSSPGGPIYGDDATAPTSATTQIDNVFTSAAPTAQNTEKWYDAEIDVSNMVSRREDGHPDTLFVTIQRTAGDSHGGDVALIAIDAKYLKWCDGGHI